MNRITRCVSLGFSRCASMGPGLLLAGILAAGCGTLQAQNDAPPPPGPGGPMHRGGGGGPERQVEMLTKVLSLTADQQTQVKALLLEQHGKMEALRKATPAATTDAEPQGRPANRAQMEAIRTDTDAKISALLNDEQKTKFSALQAERAARMQHHGGPDGPPPPPPGV